MYVIDSYRDIRPYSDDEVTLILNLLRNDPSFLRMACHFFIPKVSYRLPTVSKKTISLLLKYWFRDVYTVYHAQTFLKNKVLRPLFDRTMDLTVSGLEYIQKGVPYLFISNHRDIVMDPAILNFVLHEKEYSTARLGIGNNLLSDFFISYIIKLNKGFIVFRELVSKSESQDRNKKLSQYIKNSLLDANSSIWLAQSSGRSKDSKDRTNPALVRMLAMSFEESSENSLKALLSQVNILPVSISYEFDPCDQLKANELLERSQNAKYKKKAEEDKNSMITGIMGKKGRVHIAFTPQIENTCS